ncbi:MAG: helix-turn-helix transcriptional regulator, partial [Rhizobiaceae bacterium]
MTSGNPMAQFGDAVRRARIGRGWTLEQLAHEALGNQERKSYVSAVERGRKRLSGLTIQKFAKALDLPHHIVDAALGFASGDAISDAVAVQSVEALASDVENLRRELKLSESLVIALAWEFAEGNPADRDTALRGLRRALEVARDMQTERQRGTNLGGDVDAVLKRLEELTAAGDLE